MKSKFVFQIVIAGFIYAGVLFMSLGLMTHLELLIVCVYTVLFAYLLKSFIPVPLILAVGLFLIIPLAAMSGAAIDYFRGKAALKTMGHARNLPQDPQYRLPYIYRGCLVSGLEDLSQGPYNRTLKTMVKMFGFPASSYQGHLPERAEALVLLKEQGRPATREFNSIYSIKELSLLLRPSFEMSSFSDTAPLKYVILQDRLMLLGQDRPEVRLYIFDTETGRAKFEYPDL